MLTSYQPTEMKDYLPETIRRIICRIEESSYQNIGLVGYGTNFKWCYRALVEKGFSSISFYDVRVQFHGYDFGGKTVQALTELTNASCDVLVVVHEDIAVLKKILIDIAESAFSTLPVLYERAEQYCPLKDDDQYRGILERARLRAVSMISEQQLFDLVQFIENTADIPGDIVEYGTLYGGSAAVLNEAISEFCPHKKLKIFDSFSGIPKSRFGVDFRWNKSFCDTSLREVSNAFADVSRVEIISGDITETYNSRPGTISFGYLASDTYTSACVLAPYIWKNLSPGGILCVCDYGSYPNCVPITAYIDNFIRQLRGNAFVYRPEKLGIFIIKSTPPESEKV